MEKPNIQKATAEARSALRRASAHALPVNPSERGWKPDDIRRALWQPVIGWNGSLLQEQDRMVEEINAALSELYDALGLSEELEGVLSGSHTLTGAINRFFQMYGATADELSVLRRDVVGGEALTTEANTLTGAVNELDALLGDFQTIDRELAAGSVADMMNRTALYYRVVNAEVLQLFERMGKVAQDSNALTNGCSTVTGGINANYILCKRAHARMDVADTFLGDKTLETDGQTVTEAVNELKNGVDRAYARAVALGTQVDGIARNYVIRDFAALLSFLGGEPIPVGEEVLYADGLKTGDNLLLIENNVPDFWYESTVSEENAERYEYDGVSYDLLVRDRGSGEICGCLHISESDYTVIAGYATSASESAAAASRAKNDAQTCLAESQRTVLEAEARGEALVGEVRTLYESLYFDQAAPPFDTLNDSVFLETPTLAMLAAE